MIFIGRSINACLWSFWQYLRYFRFLPEDFLILAECWADIRKPRNHSFERSAPEGSTLSGFDPGLGLRRSVGRDCADGSLRIGVRSLWASGSWPCGCCPYAKAGSANMKWRWTGLRRTSGWGVTKPLKKVSQISVINQITIL